MLSHGLNSQTHRDVIYIHIYLSPNTREDVVSANGVIITIGSIEHTFIDSVSVKQ